MKHYMKWKDRVSDPVLFRRVVRTKAHPQWLSTWRLRLYVGYYLKRG
jgi:hypothetical protein